MKKIKLNYILPAILLCLTLSGCTFHGTIEGLPSSKYYGSVDANGRLLLYDIRTADTGIELSFSDYSDKSPVQRISYDLKDDFNPDTVKNGLQVIDVNNDGIDDFLMDIGIYGKLRHSTCFVYDVVSGQYVKVEGFDSLNAPKFYPGKEVFLTEAMPMDVPAVIEKYSITKTELILVSDLSIVESESGATYTEREFSDGCWNIIKQDVPENEITLSDWGL